MRYQLGEFVLDIATRALRNGDDLIPTEPQVFDVLTYLVENRDRAVAKTELLDEIWGDRFVSESALTSRIRMARSLLGDSGRAQKLIRTIHGFGYQYVGDAAVDNGRAAASNDEQPEVDEENLGAGPRDEGIDGMRSASPEVLLAHTIAVDDLAPFTGRRSELEAVAAALGGSGSNQVFIGGHPGIGKSRLAIEAVSRVEAAGVVVCGGRCSQLVTSAFQPLRDALIHLAEAWPLDFPRWSRGLEPILCGLAPSLARLLNAEPTGADAFAAGDVLATLFERITSEQPLLIFIDDIHWSDEPTRALLSRFFRRFGDLSMAVVGTYRTNPGDLPSEVHRWIEEQHRRGGAVKIELEELSTADAHQLAANVLGEERGEQLDLVLELTGGHCFFLVETLRDVERGASATTSIESLIAGRLEGLPEQAANLVRAAAFLGIEFPFDLAAQVAELAPVDALEAVDVGLKADLLHETSSLDRFQFSHRLVPEAIRAGMSRPSRVAIHHRCYQALQAAGGDEVEAAVHQLESVPLVPLEEAIKHSRSVAAKAHASFDFDRAARLLDRALDTDPGARVRAELLVEIGDILHHAGRGPEAAPRFEQAAEIGRSNGWTDILVDAALGHFGRSPYRNLLDSTTLELLDEADAGLGPEPSKPKALIMAKIAAFSLFTRRLAEQDELSRRAIEMAGETTPEERLHLLETRSVVFGCPAGVAEVERLDPELVALRKETGVLMADAAAPEVAPYFRGDGRRLRQERDAFDPADALPGIWEWRNLQLNSLISAMEGDIDAARIHCDLAGSIGETFWGDSSPVLHGLGQLFCDAISGRWERSLEMFEFLAMVNSSSLLTAPLAWAQAATGDLTEARATADAIRVESLDWFGEHIIGGNALIAAAEAALLLDDDRLADAAEGALSELSDLLLGLPWAGSLAAADPLSRLAARRGDEAAAERHRTVAFEIYSRVGAPALAARLG